MKLENQIILITSNEPWGDMWFSKQHYAYELSKLGYQVYFINPTSKWHWRNIFSFKIKFKSSSYENLTIVDYKNNFPQTIFKRFFTEINDFLNCVKLNRYIKLNNSNLIWWKFDPFRFLRLSPYNKSKNIYHVVDYYANIWQDKYHVKNSDLIVCCNKEFHLLYTTKYTNKKIIYIPHGVSEDEFEQDEKKINLIKQKYGNYVLMAGTISDLINFDLLKNILDKSTLKVLIVGKKVNLNKENESKWKKIVKKSNLEYIGFVNGKELKNLVIVSKFCIVLYNNNLKHQTSLKILSYLSQNKIVISSITGEFSTLLDKAIYFAENNNEYLDLYKKAEDNKLYINTKLVNYVINQRNYKNLINNIIQEI